jgi:hypothetical protein
MVAGTMTDWFRSWHGAPTDPKWLGIARRAGVAPGIAVAVGWALMDRASQAEDRGSIAGYDADGLACFYGCEPEQVDAIVMAMTDKGMVADGRLSNWEKRQPKREDGAAERARQWRERNRTQPNASEPPEEIQIQNKKEDAIASKARAKKTDPEFDDWYSRYPHKVQRGQAEKAFAAARKVASLDDLIAGLHRYISHKPEDRQWRNPATWLNGKGWLDEPGGPPIRNARWPTAPPRQTGVSAAAQRIMESEANGSEGFFGNHGDAQRVSATGSGGSRDAASDLPGGLGQLFVASDR